MIRLYSYFRSSTSYRIRIALHLKALSFEAIPVNLLKDENAKPDYRAVNPQGRVPTLVHDDFTITQSMAIMEYLDDIAPKPPLVWGDAKQRAVIRQLSQVITCDLHPLTNRPPLRYLTGVLKQPEEEKSKWYAHFAHRGLAGFEALLRQRGWAGAYCVGDQLSMADLCLIPQMYNMRRFRLPVDEFPLCAGIEKNCLRLEAFQRAAPESQPDAPEGLDAIHGYHSPLLSVMC